MPDDDVLAADPTRFDARRLDELTRAVDGREIPDEPQYLRAAGPIASQYFEVWETYEVRSFLTSTLERPGHPERAADAVMRRRLDEMPAVPALYALGANAAVVQDLIDGRWQVMRAAREDGATWEQIGRALRTTKEGAQDFYKRWGSDKDAPPEPVREPITDEHATLERARELYAVDHDLEPVSEETWVTLPLRDRVQYIDKALAGRAEASVENPEPA